MTPEALASIIEILDAEALIRPADPLRLDLESRIVAALLEEVDDSWEQAHGNEPRRS